MKERDTIRADDLLQEFFAQAEDIFNSMPPANIIVAGKTGAGKSTLINAVFGEKFTQTGIGKPVTRNIQRIKKEGVPLTLYDTKGLEMGKDSPKDTLREIHGLIDERLLAGKPEEYIHIVWYCINCMGNRLEEGEEVWLREFIEGNSTRKLPVVLVLTNCISYEQMSEFHAYLEELNRDLGAEEIIDVLALPYMMPPMGAFGLKRLIERTLYLLPDAVRNSFIQAQQADLECKIRAAQKCLRKFAFSAFTIGFSPLPCSDAPLLISAQVAMIARISSIFGVKTTGKVFAAITGALIGPAGAAITGRAFVANLFKCFPGVGTAAGGFISGSTAASLTLAMGELYIRVLANMSNSSTEPEHILIDIAKSA